MFYVICKLGGRGVKVCVKFFDKGIENIVNVEGGMDVWVDVGLFVVCGVRVMLLEC